MKLIDTRIRVEKSGIKEQYFPEYCLEWKTLFGKVKTEWYGVTDMSSHGFGGAYRRACLHYHRHSKEWAERIIDDVLETNQRESELELHERIKKTTYYKYP